MDILNKQLSKNKKLQEHNQLPPAKYLPQLELGLGWHHHLLFSLSPVLLLKGQQRAFEIYSKGKELKDDDDKATEEH